MTRDRIAGGVVGVAAIAVAVWAVSTDPALLPADTGQIITIVLGAVVIMLGVVYGLSRPFVTSGGWQPEAPETGTLVSTPGTTVTAIDDAEFRARLRVRAKRTLVDAGATPTEASADIDAGAWTDDPLAAAYLASDRLPVSRWRRLVWALLGDPATRRARRRATAAVRRLREQRFESHE